MSKRARTRSGHTGRLATHGLCIDSMYRATTGEFVVIVSGDLDLHEVDSLRRIVLAGLASGRPTVLRLDGIGMFGSAGARAVRSLLDDASDLGASFAVEGVPGIVRRVLEIVGVEDDRIEAASDTITEIPASVFDSVMAAGALRAREPICLTTSDPEDPRIVFVNDAFTALTGFTSNDVVGTNPKRLQGPLTDRAVLDRLKADIRAGEDFAGETVNYRADGSPFWMNWRIFTVSHGTNNYFMALQRDVTAHRQLLRYSDARAQLTRVINRTLGTLEPTRILEALATAVGTVVESAEAVIAVAITDVEGTVLVANLEGSFADPRLFTADAEQTFEADDTTSIHFPFDIDENLIGHILVTGLHRDWLRLIDSEHLLELCDSVIAPLRSTVVR